jgi:hypothetical protein
MLCALMLVPERRDTFPGRAATRNPRFATPAPVLHRSRPWRLHLTQADRLLWVWLWAGLDPGAIRSSPSSLTRSSPSTAACSDCGGLGKAGTASGDRWSRLSSCTNSSAHIWALLAAVTVARSRQRPWAGRRREPDELRQGTSVLIGRPKTAC